MLAPFTGIVVALLGLALGGGGLWLIAVGGTFYYFVLGLGFMLVGVLLMMRRRSALVVYAVIVAASLAWSVSEVGLDWWQLAPRGGFIAVLGVWLLVPWVAKGLGQSASRGSGAVLSLTLAVAILVAIGAVLTKSNDLEGRLAEAPPDAEPAAEGEIPPGEWHAYGRTNAGTRYSPLDSITPANVENLKVAWTFHTGDTRRPGDPNETTYEVTPLMVGDTLYLCTPHHLAIALDATTGEERWRFDPQVPVDASRQHQTCRGVTYHETTDAGVTTSCQRKIFLPTADARLYALNADTGERCPDFGDDGAIDLWTNMPHVSEGFYYSTSPPVATRDLLVVGGAVNDNVSTTEPSGVIRAYDVQTGELRWNWDPGNPTQTEPIAAGETYTENSPNSWSILSADEELGLVYVPMGNQPPDQWGGNRDPVSAPYSSAVVALELATGQVRWSFQTVHHDLWDMDVPAQPSLVDLDMPEGIVPALVQPTKQGDIYVLDRRTGEPILPVEEVAAPQGAAAGDKASPTQPVSALTFRPQRPLEGRDMWGLTPFDQLYCRIRFHSLRYEGIYTPPSTQGTLQHPGNFGVFNWGGVAIDLRRQAVVGTPSYLAFVVTLIPRDNPNTNYVSEGEPGLNENYGAPFAVDIRPFVSPLGLPCQAPPWGYIAGADLRTGKIVWRHKNGTVEDRSIVPLPAEMGVPDLGGPLVTAGGVAFVSGTLDYYVRAYDVATGVQLWEDRLPAGGQATPMSYADDSGRQYVVVVAGGHGSLGTKAGDAIIAYTLP